MRVLVTEDDEILATTLAAGLRREGMAVDVALDGAAALEHLAVNRYDVVVLDRDLPGVPGDDVCRALAAGRSETRVLMLTRSTRASKAADGKPLSCTSATPSNSTR
jgi:DNA-binding response OmpR family regulator